MGYGQSAEGERAPLRRIDLDEERPADLPRVGIRYTPTFVLFACNREVGRITGYPGADFFYPHLDRLLADFDAKPQADCS